MEETKPVVLGINEFQHREKINLNIFSESSDHQDSDAREYNNGFPIRYLSTSATFLIEILMEEFELILAEK